MPGSTRSGVVVFVAYAAALAACSSATQEPQRCETAAECAAGARCISSACVANAAPVPGLVLPSGPLETNVLLSLDASQSHDPDADDSIVSYAWTLRSLTAPCPPPVVAGTEPLASVRFGCPGRYAVDLTVSDELSATATETQELDVVAYTGAPMVTVGPDVTLDHTCTSLPTTSCTTSEAVALSAAAPAFDSGAVTFEWTVEAPPNRPLDANRRVIFDPGPLVPSPAITIETDGQAISGDWIFRVEARDAAGLIGSAAIRASVTNRPPVLEKTIPWTDHRFDGAQLIAAGEIPFTVTDPDGDPLLGPVLEAHHVGDGAGTFTADLLDGPARVAFAIAVPYAGRDDALHLIGGVGLERTIAFEVEDVNGAQTAETWPIVVGNRTPVLVSAPDSVFLEHWYDAQTQAYRADPPLSSWADPDDDPLFQVPTATTGDAECSTFTVDAGSGARLAHAHCALPFGGAPAVWNFAGLHTLTQAIEDPWGSRAPTSTVAVTIGNRAPSITSTADDRVQGACSVTGCCANVEGECIKYRFNGAPVTTTVPSRWHDPDGDPLDVQVSSSVGFVPEQPLVCTPSTCSLKVHIAAVSACGSESATLSTTATDGLYSTPATPLRIVRFCWD